MKRLIILAFLLALVGCSKEHPNSIIGTWALIDYTAVNVRTGEKVAASTDVKTWSFTKKGSAYVNGSTPMTYTITGKYLTLVQMDSRKEMTYEIEHLVDSHLKVSWYWTPGQYQDGMDCHYTFIKME